MTIPTTREEFKAWVLRNLGDGVIQINVSAEQVDDRVDEALKYFADYHFDGTEKLYYKYPLTQTDIDNQYITLPDNIIGAISIFPVGEGLNTNNMFNIRYQIALNDLYTLTSVSMVPYYMAMSWIATLEQLLVGQQPVRYNRVNNKFYIDMDWDRVVEGEYIIVEAYGVVDPDTYSRIWREVWLQKYATCLVKMQWGNNLKKYGEMKMPGGLTFNGQQIYNEAAREREILEHEISNVSLPSTDLIG